MVLLEAGPSIPPSPSRGATNPARLRAAPESLPQLPRGLSPTRDTPRPCGTQFTPTWHKPAQVRIPTCSKLIGVVTLRGPSAYARFTYSYSPCKQRVRVREGDP